MFPFCFTRESRPRTNIIRFLNGSQDTAFVFFSLVDQYDDNKDSLFAIEILDPSEEKHIRGVPLGVYRIRVFYGRENEIVKRRNLLHANGQSPGLYTLYIYNQLIRFSEIIDRGHLT